MKAFKTVMDKTEAEITEKRSRFIATLAHVENEQAALSFLNEMRSMYWDARHNVYAYSLSSGTKRFSDDGEPHGTAGKPVLDVINGNGLDDVIIVVTRYFGGVLLGTGGLVRAYSSAAAEVVKNAEVCEMTPCITVKTECEYPQYDRLSKILEGYSCHIISTDYADKINISLLLAVTEKQRLEEEIKEAFFADLSLNYGEEISFPIKK
ncbi:MAG: YigZ family protein [Clostridiales bacterium]|nr:YigZ family protein [Candidatus Equinaster intestinalis]